MLCFLLLFFCPLSTFGHCQQNTLTNLKLIIFFITVLTQRRSLKRKLVLIKQNTILKFYKLKLKFHFELLKKVNLEYISKSDSILVLIFGASKSDLVFNYDCHWELSSLHSSITVCFETSNMIKKSEKNPLDYSKKLFQKFSFTFS